MKKSLIAAVMISLAIFTAKGQLIEGKSFFENESDSIAEARMDAAAKELGLNARQAERLARLYSGQYEELCRGLQMSIMQQRMKQEAGLQNSANDSEAKEAYDGTCLKYEQRYMKELGEELFGKWRKLQGISLDCQYDSLLEYIRTNTESYF